MAGKESNGIFQEDEFAKDLSVRAKELFDFMIFLKQKPPKSWVKRHYSVLSQLAHDMESFLDDYHARYNKRFSFITELCACLKWFGYSGFLQKHILVRFPNYALKIPNKTKLQFNYDSQKTLEYLNQSILSLLGQLEKEAKKLKIKLPKEVPEGLFPNDPYQKRKLPQNIDEEVSPDQQHVIAEIATLYKNVAGEFKKIEVDRDMSLEDIKNQTLYELDETKTRRYESMIHNIQSKYDTYLKNTRLESDNSSLRLLRGYSSLSLHLFEMATVLVHFYERHENDIRYEKTKKKTGAIIPKDDLLQVLNGYVRYYGVKFILLGEEFADDLIKTYVEIGTIAISPREDFALHARPLSLIAKIALTYNSPLEIEIGGETCPAGSIMQMILLAGNNPFPKKITFKGEERALRDVKDLFEHVFCNDEERGEVPPRLAYLFK